MSKPIDCEKLDRDLAKIERLAKQTADLLEEIISDLGGPPNIPEENQAVEVSSNNSMKSGHNLHISDEVMDVLKRSTITENKLVLPPERMDRKLYEGVKKVLELAGGKWKTGPQAFVFPGDPRAKLGMALETGVVVDEKKRDQAFYTPADLAQEVAEMANVGGQEVLEPSAGAGALMIACLNEGAKHVCGIEKNEETCQKLHQNLAQFGNHSKVPYSVVCRDFLEHPVPDTKNELYRFYDRVVMNPPFTKGTDLKHIAHALKFLKPGGRLVSLMAAGRNPQQLAGREPARLQAIVKGYQHDIIDLEPGRFKVSGTNIATSILIANKPHN